MSEKGRFVIPQTTEMGQIFNSLDWSQTPLGPTFLWPQSLRTAASICITNRFPSLIMWGPQAVQIYNDGYSPILGPRHPSLGKSAKEVWWDIWSEIGPMVDHVTKTGQAIYLKDNMLLCWEEGYWRERYFTYSESPIFIENNTVGGVLNTVSETTEKIFNERQLKSLGDIASHATEASSVKEACDILAKTMATNPYDIPFASIYLGDTSHHLLLMSTVHLDKETDLSPLEIREGQLYESVNQEKFAQIVSRVSFTGVEELMDLSGFTVPKSPAWKEVYTSTQCKIIPIPNVNGVIVIGVSPTRVLTEGYSNFLSLVAVQISSLISNARTHEEERRKADMLTELDRAKTNFFSNISHEFRTPITLMLGPIEDLIFKEKGLPETDILDQLELIHRNALRLLKLVNALLDFSRLEAGRMEATFQPSNISQLTTDLASIFRSACERVGIELLVDCQPTSDPVYLDVDLYEKIVMNLVSNAYKFTMNGHIAISIKQLGKQAVQLCVEDTGTGIPEEELPRLFQRFHRVPDTAGRTHEGTGIGLAMVQELVKIHGGTIQVYSKLGQGTLFILTFPFGNAHLTSNKIKDSSIQGTSKPAYVRTAEWWIGSDPKKSSLTPEIPSKTLDDKPRILVCDDNADMREYLYNLLHEHYELDMAPDGIVALQHISQVLPNLVISDIQMPKLDGFGLLRKLRNDEKTRTIPVIFLSARAGEESRAEGLSSGADDYLVKPFTARELLARVKSHLELYKIRQESAMKAEAAANAKDHFLAVLSHELRTPLTPALLLAESLEKDTTLPLHVRKDLDTVYKSIKLEVKLIDDLLDVTKISKNKLVLHVKSVDAHSELEAALELTKIEAIEKNIQLEVQLEAKLSYIEADPTKLQQVFVNIIRNAIKFTPENGWVRILSSHSSDQFHVNIVDSGIGIPTESLPKIFDSFQQANNTAARFGGKIVNLLLLTIGLGLGLSISKAIVNMMGGTISAHSDGPDTGSTFSVAFPLSSPPDVEPEVTVPPQKILLTEDNKSTALVMSRLLNKMGHDVKTAYCVKDDLAAAHTFDMLISDVGLPDGTGFQLMKTLKSIYGLNGICVTGFGMQEDIQLSKESGFDIHIVKPVEMQALQSAISFVYRQIQIKKS